MGRAGYDERVYQCRYDMMVLAGGTAERLAGQDKPALVVGSRPLIESVIAAGTGAERVIVVGSARPGLDGVVFVREEPPGSGPVPALRRGLADVTEPLVAVLAADLPFLREKDLASLLRAAASASAGAVLVDDAGRAQWLAGCWRTGVLRRALDGYSGRSLHGLFGPLEPVLVHAERAPGEPPPWLDCDTLADLERARRLAGD